MLALVKVQSLWQEEEKKCQVMFVCTGQQYLTKSSLAENTLLISQKHSLMQLNQPNERYIYDS